MLTVTVVDGLVALLVIATAYSRGLDPLRPPPRRCALRARRGAHTDRDRATHHLRAAGCRGLACSIDVRSRSDRHRAGHRPRDIRRSGRARKPREGLRALPPLPRATNAGARAVGA